MATIVQNVDPTVNYLFSVRSDNRLHYRITAGVYAIPQQGDRGEIIRQKFRIVEHLQEGVYECTCKKPHCIHVKVAELLYPRDDFQNKVTLLFKQNIRILQLHVNVKEKRQIFGIFNETTNSFGVIKQTPAQIICLSCSKRPQSCNHRKTYINERPEANIAIHQPQQFNVKSKEPISYPLKTHKDRELFNGYFLGVSYPNILIPKYYRDKTCRCGNRYKEDCPIQSNWISCRNAVLHTSVVDIEVITYYRPTVGNCKCIQEYDGRLDHIINVNNKHLFTYVWLMNILHNTQHTRFPLYSAFSSSNDCRVISGNIPRKMHFYEDLRVAYNAFIRLLEFDETCDYSCDKCGDNVDIIIIDATAVGFNMNLMPPAPDITLPTVQIPEYAGGDRVFVANIEARKSLAAYAGLIKGQYVRNPAIITDTEFNSLKRLLARGNQALCDVVSALGNPCPEPLRKMIGELSHNNPTSGMFQLVGQEARGARVVLEEIANNNFTNLAASHDLLEKYCPLVIAFLSSDLVPLEYKSSLMKEILSSIDGIFRMQLPQPDKYGPIESASNDLEKFPKKLIVRGPGKYEASKDQLTDCNKSTTKKRTLSSGIFTFFCPHGICYGFQLMRTPESPRIPFDILMRRFQTMPRIIIYDNACKLHTYCLKREPARFKDTKFLVDRLHFRNHIACTLGYSMDTYSSDEEIKQLNSQVCEQANADIRLLATQIAHMTPDNAMHHLSVFLSIRNMKKHVKMRQLAENE